MGHPVLGFALAARRDQDVITARLQLQLLTHNLDLTRANIRSLYLAARRPRLLQVDRQRIGLCAAMHRD